PPQVKAPGSRPPQENEPGAHAVIAPVAPPPPKNRERYRKITAAEWEARERPRQLLENILRRQVETCEDQRKALRQEARKGPSPYEWAAEIAPSHADALMMRRTQD